MANENVIFKKGLSTSLPEEITPGALLVETDTGKMYLDSESELIVTLSDVKVDAITYRLSTETSGSLTGILQERYFTEGNFPTELGQIYYQTAINQFLKVVMLDPGEDAQLIYLDSAPIADTSPQQYRLVEQDRIELSYENIFYNAIAQDSTQPLPTPGNYANIPRTRIRADAVPQSSEKNIVYSLYIQSVTTETGYFYGLFTGELLSKDSDTIRITCLSYLTNTCYIGDSVPQPTITKQQGSLYFNTTTHIFYVYSLVEAGTYQWVPINIADQTYNPESANAQSGIAMSQALAPYTNKILQRLIYLRCTTKKDNPVKRIDEFSYEGYFYGYAVIWFEYGCTEISDIRLSGTNYSYFDLDVKLESESSFIGLFNFTGNGKVFFIQYFGMDYLQAKFADVNISNAEVQLLVDNNRDISILRKDSKVPAEILIGDPTIDEAAATKRYVDTSIAQAIDTCSPAIVTASDTGKALNVNDSSERALKGLTAYGESTQDGTPTPDIPVEIVSVENPVISVYGKNLIPYPYEETRTTINGVTITYGDDGSIIFNGTATANIYFKVFEYMKIPADTYYLSGTPAEGRSSTMFLYIYDTDNPNVVYNAYTASGVLCSLSGTYYSGRIYIKSGLTVENLTFKPQLELGTTATPYQPYIEPQTITIPYTFRGLKNSSGEWTARDELRVGDGKVEIVRNVGIFELQGTEVFTMTGSSPDYKLFYTAVSNYQRYYGLCNYYKVVSNGVSAGQCSLSDRLYFGDSRFTAVADFKSWLSTQYSAGNPVVYYYSFETAAVEDITATEAGQALLALKSNYPSTSVISDIDLNITYKADTKNYIDNKIAALTALTLEG